MQLRKLICDCYIHFVLLQLFLDAHIFRVGFPVKMLLSKFREGMLAKNFDFIGTSWRLSLKSTS